MTQRSYALLLLAVVFVFIFMPLVPFTVSAQGAQFIGDTGPAGIVPCGDAEDVNSQCGFCDLVTLAQQSISFAVYFTVFVATLLFMFAGFKYITAGGDSGKISEATAVFGKVVVGLVIVLVAWLVVDTVLKTFFTSSPLNHRFGPWNEITCEVSLPQNTNENNAEIRPNYCFDWVNNSNPENRTYGGGCFYTLKECQDANQAKAKEPNIGVEPCVNENSSENPISAPTNSNPNPKNSSPVPPYTSEIGRASCRERV